MQPSTVFKAPSKGYGSIALILRFCTSVVDMLAVSKLLQCTTAVKDYVFAQIEIYTMQNFT